MSQRIPAFVVTEAAGAGHRYQACHHRRTQIPSLSTLRMASQRRLPGEFPPPRGLLEPTSIAEVRSWTVNADPPVGTVVLTREPTPTPACARSVRPGGATRPRGTRYRTTCTATSTSLIFWTISAHFSAPLHPARAVSRVLLGAHADRGLICAWNPML